MGGDPAQAVGPADNRRRASFAGAYRPLLLFIVVSGAETLAENGRENKEFSKGGHGPCRFRQCDTKRHEVSPAPHGCAVACGLPQWIGATPG
jgi:hypothetical protein